MSEKYDELRKLEEETKYVLPYSPTLRVGDGFLEGFNKYTHKGKTLSWIRHKVLKE